MTRQSNAFCSGERELDSTNSSKFKGHRFILVLGTPHFSIFYVFETEFLYTL
jgi:hypothetical protein